MNDESLKLQKKEMKEVHGKVAFITGGSSGIGLGIARAFVKAGMKVVIGYQTQRHLEEAMTSFDRTGDRVHAIRVNVTDRPGMQRAAAETLEVFGKVHVLVNNAGVSSLVSLSDATYDDWHWMMDVNLNGVFNGVHAFLPHIKAHGEGGHIVATASVLGLFASELMSIYCVSKFAVVGMMEALRAELTGTSIGVSVFCPGSVNSNIGEAERNRPGHAATMSSEPGRQRGAHDREAGKQLEMDPLEAGRLVLRGVCNNDLYILSHPEFEQGIRERNEALVASIPAGPHPPDARIALARPILRNPIYARERDRKVHECVSWMRQEGNPGAAFPVD